MFALIVSMLAAGPAHGKEADGIGKERKSEERFFIALFAYQTPDNPIENSHTFATLLRTDRGCQKVRESLTISWCSTTNIIKLTRPAEPGDNKSLEQTLAYAVGRKLDIFLCALFETKSELFERAAAQVKRLKEGRLRYQVVDRFNRNQVKNCISAVADLYEDDGRLDTGAARGYDATMMVLEHLRPFYVDHGVTGPEKDRLITALGLKTISFQDTSEPPLKREDTVGDGSTVSPRIGDAPSNDRIKVY